MKKIRMKRWVKSTLAIVVIIFLVLTTVMYSFGAQMFTDVTNKHWGQQYIENMASKKVITGYSDATFKPDKSVSRIEAIVMITRLFDEKEVQDVYEKNNWKYEKKLKESEILNYASWAKEEIVFALEKNFLNENALEGFLKNGTPENALRYEVAVYLARGLGFESELNKVAVLSFKDADKISKNAIPYIDILIKKGIIDGKGDYKGEFNPNNPVTRAEFAKMLSVGYTLLNKGNNTQTDTQVKPETKPDTNTSVEEKEKEEEKEGYFYNATFDANGKHKVTFKINDKYVDYIASSDTKVKLDEMESSIYKLSKEDKVTIKVVKDNLKEVDAISKEVEIKGIVKDISSSKITIKKDDKKDDKTYKYELDKDVTVKRNNKSADIEDIREGDEVELEIEYEVVQKIDAESVTKKIEGTLKEIKMSQNPEITILDKDNKTQTYKLVSGFEVEIDDDPAGLYDLRVNHKVELQLESGEVKKIESDQKATLGSYTGKILNISTKDKTIELENNVDGKKIYVRYESSTPILDSDGDKKGSSKPDKYLDEDDIISVVGEDKLGSIDATMITIIEDK